MIGLLRNRSNFIELRLLISPWICSVAIVCVVVPAVINLIYNFIENSKFAQMLDDYRMGD